MAESLEPSTDQRLIYTAVYYTSVQHSLALGPIAAKAHFLLTCTAAALARAVDAATSRTENTVLY